MRSLIHGFVLVAAGLASQSASAATYLLDYTADSGIFSGSFTTSDRANADGYYVITSFSGTKNGIDVVWDSSKWYSAANLFKMDYPYFTGADIRYTAGGSLYTLYAFADPLECAGNATTCTPSAITRISVSEATSSVPEPSEWAMLICGFGLLGAGMRRARSKVRFA